MASDENHNENNVTRAMEIVLNSLKELNRKYNVHFSLSALIPNQRDDYFIGEASLINCTNADITMNSLRVMMLDYVSRMRNADRLIEKLAKGYLVVECINDTDSELIKGCYYIVKEVVNITGGKFLGFKLFGFEKETLSSTRFKLMINHFSNN